MGSFTGFHFNLCDGKQTFYPRISFSVTDFLLSSWFLPLTKSVFTGDTVGKTVSLFALRSVNRDDEEGIMPSKKEIERFGRKKRQRNDFPHGFRDEIGSMFLLQNNRRRRRWRISGRIGSKDSEGEEREMKRTFKS